MATQPITRLTEDEYLQLERAAKEKSEFVDGEMFLIAGASPRHLRLTINWTLCMGNRLAGSIYVLFPSDTRIVAHSIGSYVYADLSVVEGKPEFYKRDNLINPTAVVEVLSPSTADYDHGKKFSLYREIPSFAEYLLVHTDSTFVEHYSDGSWVLRDYRGTDAELRIPALGCTVKLAEVYAGVFEIPE